MKAATETKIFRNYAKYDPAKFCEDLRGVNWVDSMNSSGTANENVICVDKLWLNFKTLVTWSVAGEAIVIVITV